MTSKRKSLLELANAGLAAVQPRAVLSAVLSQQAPAGECYVLAIGKAAAGMYDAAAEYLGSRLLDGRVVLPESSGKPATNVVTLAGEHPVPGEGSFAAGKGVHAWLQHLEVDIPLLLLLSGGGSALLEMPVPNISKQQCRDVHVWCLGSGLPIHAVNAIRSRFSALKSGGLAAAAGQREIAAWVISDVPGNELRYVASGPVSAELVKEFDGAVMQAPEWIRELAVTAADVPRKNAKLIRLADNATALMAITAAASAKGFDVIEQGSLSGDAEHCARAIAARIADAPSGLYLYGGETTVTLPETPGRGGRNQQLALALALAFAGALQGKEDWCALALATDGVDGNSEDAGALVDGGTVQRGEDAGLDAGAALSSANAGEFLEAAGDLVHTGPTGTNVMDLLLVLKG